jgi:hypothetical protein
MREDPIRVELHRAGVTCAGASGALARQTADWVWNNLKRNKLTMVNMEIINLFVPGLFPPGNQYLRSERHDRIDHRA